MKPYTNRHDKSIGAARGSNKYANRGPIATQDTSLNCSAIGNVFIWVATSVWLLAVAEVLPELLNFWIRVAPSTSTISSNWLCFKPESSGACFTRLVNHVKWLVNCGYPQIDAVYIVSKLSSAMMPLT